MIEENKYEKLFITGGKKLFGDIKIDGSKNSMSAILPAICLQKEGTSVISNVPTIADLEVHRNILGELGFKTEYSNNELIVHGYAKNNAISAINAGKVRSSTLYLGTLLGLFGEARIPLPGGDNLGGKRPIDIHLEGLSMLGVKSTIKDGMIYAKADKFPLQGNDIFLRFPSVGATQNLIIAATLASGVTTIYNAAMEPEVVDMAILLNKMGAKITGVGTHTVRIVGASGLKGVCHEILPDRLEVGTLLLGMAVTGGYGTIENCIPEHSISIISILRKCGVDVTFNNNSISISSDGELQSFVANAMPYPGMPTDLQPLITAFASQCNGITSITDGVSPERFSHVEDLKKFGCNIERYYNNVIVKGKSVLTGADVCGDDIRTVTSLIIAALVAEGQTTIGGVYHLKRGHANLVEKLKALGADIYIK